MYSIFGGYTDEVQRKNLYERIQNLRKRSHVLSMCDVYDYSDRTQIGGYVVLENVDLSIDELDHLGVFDRFNVHHAEYDWRRGQDRIEQVLVV